MASRKEEFYLSIKAILDKTELKNDAKKLQDLLSHQTIDFDSADFEKAVRKVVDKMSKETLSSIIHSFNVAVKSFGKEINIDELLGKPNLQMWEGFGDKAGRFFAEGLTDAINDAIKSIDWSGVLDGIKGASGKSGGIAIDLGLNEQVKELKQQRQELQKELDELEKEQKRLYGRQKTKAGKVQNFDGIARDNNPYFISDEKKKSKQTQTDEYVSHFNVLVDKIKLAKDEYIQSVEEMKNADKDSAKYNAATIIANEKLRELQTLREALVDTDKFIHSTLYGRKQKEYEAYSWTVGTKKYSKEKDEELFSELGRIKNIGIPDEIKEELVNQSGAAYLLDNDDVHMVTQEFVRLNERIEETSKRIAEVKEQLQELDGQMNSLGISEGSNVFAETPKKRGRPKKTDKDIVDITQNSIGAAEEKLEVEKEILETKKETVKNERLLSKLSSASNLDKEKFAYLNTETGHISQHIEGEYGTVSKQAQQELFEKVTESVNSTLHTHPELVAAPSEDDIKNFANKHALFKKNFILAGEQLAEIDFTSMSDAQAQELAAAYKQNVLNAEDALDEKFNYSSFKDLGIDSLDIDGILRKTSEQLMSQFPDLQADIDEYIQNLRSMFDGAKLEDVSQNQLEGMLDGVVGHSFANTSLDLKADIYQATLDIVNNDSGIPSMYQNALRDIFTQTISDLNFNPEQIFKLHNVNDFDAQLQSMRQQSMIAYQENADAVKEATEAQKALSHQVPSEDAIKGGKSSWRGVPIQYDSSLPGEARNLTDFMKVGPKFFGMDEETQRGILDHEVAHNIADRIMNQATDEWEKVADIFAPKKLLPKGANPSFYTEEDDNGNKWYREGLYGDLGATALSETLTHALTEYFSNPDAFKKRSEGAFNYLEGYINNSGDNLDNVGVEVIKEELAVQEQLNQAKKESANIDEDTLEEIQQETGSLEDKLERLQQLSDEWGYKISQKKRDRYEELNQKDMDSGLTTAEENRMSELYDDITEADNALEEFSNTYDKIILKLGNGKKVEILPDDKGLSALYKIGDEYGESYNGVEIDDVIFERKKQEISIQEQLNDAKQEERQIEQQSDTVIEDNLKKIESYEELCEVVNQYNALMHKHNAGIATTEDGDELRKLQDRIDDTRDFRLDDPYKESLAYFSTFSKVVGTTTVEKLARYLGIEIPQSADEAKQSIDELNASLEKQQKIEQVDSTQTKTAETKVETDAIAQQNETLKENIRLKQMVENASKHGVPGQSVAEAAGIPVSEGAGAGVDKQELAKILGNITYKVQIVPNNDASNSDKKVDLIDIDSLKKALEAITYKTKIVTDDGDKNANKITLDDSSLEATLHKVFANILSPATQQNDGILTAIKTAVESINNKIVQGTKVLRTSNGKKNETTSANLDIKNPKELGNVKAIKVDSRVKDLRALYEEQGALEARRDDEAAAIRLKQIEEDILSLKTAGVALDETEINNIKAKAKHNEKNRLSVEKAKEAAKQAAKDEKADLRERLRRSKEENRFGASTTAWNSGNKALESLWRIDNAANPLELKPVQDLQAALKELNAVRQRVNENLRKGIEISEQDANELREKTEQVAMHTESVKQLVHNYDELNGANVTNTNHVFGGGDLETHLRNVVNELTNGKAKIGDFDAATGKLKYTVKTGAYEFEEYEMAVRDADNATVSLHKGTKQVETFLEGFKRKLSEVTRYFSASSLIFKFFNEFRKGIQYIREIDSALTELKKVTDETEETYDKFLDTASKTASRVGSTIQEIVSSTADFARLGYSLKEAAAFAESAQILMNVSEFTDISRATDTLISAVQAFGYTAETSMDVVDLLNKIGNNYAISTADLAQSLTKSSAALVAAGGNLAEAAALTATANKIVQDADSVGTALKTTSLRLRATSVDILNEEGLDSEGAVTSKSKLQSKVKALSGVDILTETGEYKSTYEILSQIADVWEDMNDMDQAALLELISGKRNASVIAAILQNPKELKEAFEDASNAEGSALKENEKYLDSIQGRIDLLKNATQTLWHNLLDSDVVKFFVDLLTKLVKLVDEIGLLGTALGGVFIYLTAFKQQTPLALLQQIWGVIQNIGSSIKANGFGNWIGSLLGVVPALKTVTAETVANTIAIQTNDAATTKQMMTDMGLIGVTGALSAAQREQARDVVLNAMATSQLTMAQGNAMLAMLGYSAATVAADGSLKALDATTKSFMATNPIGWILAIVSVIMTVVMLLSQIPSKLERLTEELGDLRSELQNIQTELNSVNSEIETTQNRMAELLALPSLSFVEQEELDRLREQNEELERRERLLKAQEEREKKRIAETAQETLDSQLSDTSYDGGFWDSAFAGLEGALTGALAGAVTGSVIPGLGTAVGAIIGGVGGLIAGVGAEHLTNRISTEDKLNEEIEGYEALLTKRAELEEKLTTASTDGTGLFGWGKSEYDKTKEELDELDEKISETEAYIDSTLSELGATLEGVEYGYGADEALDKYYNALYKWEIDVGTIGAKADGIAHIFSRPEHEALKEGIDNYIASLAEGEELSREEIEKMISNNEALVADIEAMGLEISDVVDYFTMKGSGFNTTPEGIMEQYKTAKKVLEDLKDEKINLDDLVEYDADTNKATAKADKIAEHLQGVSPEIQKEFANIIEDVKEGVLDYEKAFERLDVYSMQAMVAYAKTQLESANKIAFPDLEISGWLDSVEELSGAFESLAASMDLVARAQEQMDSSGRISLKTALDLMASTDEWNKILEVNNGVITMNANAEQILIQSKLDLIKANIDAAIADVETQITLMEGAINSQEAGNTFTEGFTNALIECQGIMVGLRAAWDAFWSGNDVGDAFNNARNATIKNLKPTQQDLSSLYQQKDELEKKKEMLTGVDTTIEFKNNYDFDKKPGDKYKTFDDALAEAYESEMDYFENRLGANQSKYDQIQNEIDLIETKGGIAGKEYYEEQVYLENQRLGLLQEQKQTTLLYMDTLEEGSEEWWEAASTLNNIESEIDDTTASLLDLQDAMGAIEWSTFEEFNTRLDDINSKLETMRDLIAPNGEEDWFDDEGNWTDKGVAVLGSYVQSLEYYRNGLAETNKELEEFTSKEYNDSNAEWFANTYGIHSEQEYYDYLKKLEDKQYSYAKSESDIEQDIAGMWESQIDAVEEYIDTLVDGYQDYIDAVKEALDAERDLYNFKKDVQKQTKDIAALERRIASLSGSANAADIAERRKLEAELAEQREALNDTYYEHSMDSQKQALDDDAQAYEDAMNEFVENLRTNLDLALDDMDAFITGVTSVVTANAPTILGIYKDLGVAVDDALLNPWQEITNEMSGFTTEGGLAMMNAWAADGGAFDTFSANASSYLTSIWSDTNVDPDNVFENAITSKIEGIKSSIQSNVAEIKTSLSGIYSDVKDITLRPVLSGDDDSGGGGVYNPSDGNSMLKSDVAKLQEILNEVFNENLSVDGDYGSKTTEAVKRAQSTIGATADGYYGPDTRAKMANYIRTQWMAGYGGSSMYGEALELYIGKLPTSYYAKGTLGTSRNEWAMTDELGDELVMIPGKNGNLSFMRKGTSVVPADITANLVEWGKLNPDMMKVGGGANINMISNALIQPEFNFEFDSLVHVDNCSQETLKDLEKMVDNKINQFSKQMNYAIKRIGGR